MKVSQTKYRIEAMDCPTEEALIRGKLGAMPGVSRLDFNLVQRVLTVEHGLDSPTPIEEAIASLGFTALPHDERTPIRSGSRAAPAWRAWLPIASAGILALASEAAHWLNALPWLPAAFALAAVALSGLGTYKKGWIALINRNLNINALMSIAVTGALFLRQWPEAAMVMTLFALAEKIEALSLDRARKAIDTLMDLSPDTAMVQQGDGSWLRVDARAVGTGASVRVGPGERISHDGLVSGGRSSVDQSAITGESIPAEKSAGDPVYAGTVNQEGELVISVTKAAEASTLSRIIHLVEEAQSSRSATQRFVDRFATVYTPIVMAMAVLVALVPPLLFSAPWATWAYRALALLIIACPCALVISTPVTVVSGLARAARMGIIVKGGAYLEEAARLDWLAFDKTGTVTTGILSLTDRLALSDRPGLERIAASLAHRSDHPVSRAIARALADSSADALLEVDGFQALPGRGVSGRAGGTLWRLGNHRLIHELGLCGMELEELLEGYESEGKTTVVLADDAKALMVFAVADTIKESSRQALGELHGLGVKTLLISGDNERTARSIGLQAGIDIIRGDQLPEDKARAVKELKAKASLVGMVGDGVNDAPALASADIGIAMGGLGSDSAIETADVVLMDDDLRKLPQLIRLSRRTRGILAQNIAIALGIKAVFLALTLLGCGTMWMAVFADMGASLIVVYNGLRLAGVAKRGHSLAE
jgi:Cd2+/Zn2+-exporting ATPase